MVSAPTPIARWERLVLMLLFAIPFLLIAAAYDKLPAQIPVLRLSIGHVAFVAQKSPFVVFRVPLMNLIHGTMAAMMLSYAPAFTNTERRIGYSNIFSTLLYAIGLKSMFEGLELASPAVRVSAALEHWLVLPTFACVVGGLAFALWRGRTTPLPWPELRLKNGQKLALAGLFGLYLVIVVVSFAQLASNRINP